MQVGVEKRNALIVVFVLVAVAMLLKLLSLQVFDDYYKKAASSNAFYKEIQYPARGLIYDRNGKEVVVNQTVYDIMVIPREVKDVDSAEICRALRIDRQMLRTLFADLDKKRGGASGYQFVTFMKQVSAEVYAGFQEKSFKFKGFYAQTRTNRSYIRNVSGNLLGYVGEVDRRDIERDSYYQQGDYIGKSGIEESYESVLKGRKGVSIYLRDVFNRIQESYNGGLDDTAAVAGKNIVCTIDVDLQEYAEQLMVNKIGGLVAIEPSTGEILAMVSSPGFSPNLMTGQNKGANYVALTSDLYKPLFNRALMSPYPPGSTFKLANALIGLQEGVVRPETRYGCSMGYKVGRGVGCHAHPSPLDMEHSIMMSCNAYYCHVFRNIIDNPKYGDVAEGLDSWIEYVKSFGFGRRLNSDLVGEQKGILPSAEKYDRFHSKNRWKSLSIISLAIGQGEISATPLQMANFCALIANRGYYVIPHIVKKIDGQDTIEQRFREKNYCKVDAKHFNIIVQGMYLAVNSPPGSGATASRVQVPGLDICGKTGTAQNPHGEDNSTFMCFAPRENPKIAVTVYVENAGFGGTYAAPIASLLVERYLKGKVERADLEANVVATDLRPKYQKKIYKKK